MVVDVFRDLQAGGLSLRYKGRLLLNTDSLWLTDATYIVDEAGRQRVLREQRKNLHAFVRGTLSVPDDPYSFLSGVRVAYNPYEKAYFFDLQSGEEVISASWCKITSKGVMSFDTVFARKNKK